MLLNGYRVGLVAQGIAFAVIFLSFTLLTAEGGMISLCQITFAGIGAIVTGQASSVHGWRVLIGVLLGALVAGLAGLVVGALTVRMGNLYVALATLTFGLLFSTLVFDQDRRFNQLGSGVTVGLPSFISGDLGLSYLMLSVFVLLGLAIAAIRRSTTGLALSALRSTEVGARAVGVNVIAMKTILSGLAWPQPSPVWAAGCSRCRPVSRCRVRTTRSSGSFGSPCWLPTAPGRTMPRSPPACCLFSCRIYSRPICLPAGGRCRPCCSGSGPSCWPGTPKG
jgi:hypothetical protein